MPLPGYAQAWAEMLGISADPANLAKLESQGPGVVAAALTQIKSDWNQQQALQQQRTQNARESNLKSDALNAQLLGLSQRSQEAEADRGLNREQMLAQLGLGYAGLQNQRQKQSADRRSQALDRRARLAGKRIEAQGRTGAAAIKATGSRSDVEKDIEKMAWDAAMQDTKYNPQADPTTLFFAYRERLRERLLGEIPPKQPNKTQQMSQKQKRPKLRPTPVDNSMNRFVGQFRGL
jgi:hypothetical protein